jgi:hypothetical protein
VKRIETSPRDRDRTERACRRQSLDVKRIETGPRERDRKTPPLRRRQSLDVKRIETLIAQFSDGAQGQGVGDRAST